MEKFGDVGCVNIQFQRFSGQVMLDYFHCLLPAGIMNAKGFVKTTGSNKRRRKKINIIGRCNDEDIIPVQIVYCCLDGYKLFLIEAGFFSFCELVQIVKKNDRRRFFCSVVKYFFDLVSVRDKVC